MLVRLAYLLPMVLCALAHAKHGEVEVPFDRNGLRKCELRLFNPDLMHSRLTSEPVDPNDPEGFVTDAYPMSVDTMVRAYRNGLYALRESTDKPGHPRLVTPINRGVMFLDPNDPDKGISRRDLRLMKKMRAQGYVVRFDKDFQRVVEGCKFQKRLTTKLPRDWRQKRRGLYEDTTWITDPFLEVFLEMHALRHAHSAEVYLHDQQVGGLFGVEVDGVFTGESMYRVPGIGDNAVKLALYELRRRLAMKGHKFIDVEQNVGLILDWGGQMIKREDYMKLREEQAALDLTF